MVEFLPDEEAHVHVRRRSRAHGTYNLAEENGAGVALRQRRVSLNAAWAVHRLVRGGTSYVVLHSVAYGQYLILEDAPPGQGTHRVVRVVRAPEQDDVHWEAFEAEDGSGDIHMHHRTCGPRRNFDEPNTMMSWIMGAIAAIPPRV